MQTLKKLPQMAPNSPAAITAAGTTTTRRSHPCRLDAKVTGSLKRIHVVALVLSGALPVAACRGKHDAETRRPVALSQVMRPEAYAAALRKLGGAHYHATTKLAVGPAGGEPTGVTTTTDVWLDRTGNYRMHEENDQDGGRDVVLHGRELAVALRYGKMVRRVAEEPEPSQLLEQGLGAPWSLYELVSSRAAVASASGEASGGAKSTVFSLTLGEAAEQAPKPAGPLYGMRAWRESAKIEALGGQVVVDDATGALTRVDLSARFTAKGPTGPVRGHAGRSRGADRGGERRRHRAGPDAEELALRQRTVPEQRELLRGLVQSRPPPPPARRPNTEKSHGPGPGKQ